MDRHDEHEKSRSLGIVLGTRQGSALIWAMIVVLVLLVLIGVMATVVQSSYYGQKQSQVNNQAYYTARSVSERITDWLEGTPSEGVEMENNQQLFIAQLKDSTTGIVKQTYDEDVLDPSGGGKMGYAEAEISINKDDPDEDQKKTIITVKVTGYFAGNSETIVRTLKAGTNISSIDLNPATTMTVPAITTFDPDDPAVGYNTEEDRLNGLYRADPTKDELVIVGNEADQSESNGVDYNNNTTDQATANSVTGTKKELTIRGRSDSYNTVLGTSRNPPADGSNTTTENAKSDTRRFVTPPNGRWTINPLQKGGDSGTGNSKNEATAQENTRIISLSMGDFQGKDVQIRFGGYNFNPSGDSKDLINGTNYYNSLLAFDFVDNAGVTVAADDSRIKSDNVTYGPNITYDPNVKYIDYYEGGIPNGVDRWWHPQKWGSMTMFTQKTTDSVVNGGVDARLVFGPFVKKRGNDISYWNYGRYKGNPWYGQTAGDMNKAFPGNDGDSDAALNRWGMVYIPEYFGNNFRMFILDDIDKNVLIIQGVNVLGTADKHSVLYSRRGMELGGGLMKSDSTYDDGKGATTRNVNSHIDGMSFGTSIIGYPNYFGITTRYSQIIYNTDIVLRTPNGTSTPRSSRIWDATLPYDGTYYVNHRFSDVTNKWFNPTVKIIGGHMFVGAGQTLHIDGGRFNYNATYDKDGVSLNGYTDEAKTTPIWITTRTLTVSPSSLTVEQGGIVNISKPTAYYVGTTTEYTASLYKNVTTDMSVNGKVNLTTGAWAGGNAVVGSDGVMTIADTARFDGNIYVEAGGTLTVGASTIVGNIQIRNGGKVTIGAGAVITGDVYCAGELAITGNITINATDASAVDFPDTDIDESLPVGGPYKYHGIFIYDDSSVGTGTLTFPGAPTNAPVYAIEGNSGKIHTFVGYPDIDHDKAGNTFCNDCSENNVCLHWTTSSDVWQAQSGEIPGE